VRPGHSCLQGRSESYAGDGENARLDDLSSFHGQVTKGEERSIRGIPAPGGAMNARCSAKRGSFFPASILLISSQENHGS